MSIQVGTDCAILYGRNTRLERSSVLTALANAGLKTRVREPSATSALEYACHSNASRYVRESHADAVSVRALANHSGFEVSGVMRGEIHNQQSHLFSVGLSGRAVKILKMGFDGDQRYLQACLDDSFQYGLDLLSPAQVGGVVKSVVRQLHGTSLDGRCTFFLLGNAIAKWHSFARESRLERSYSLANLSIAQNQDVLNYIYQSLADKASAEVCEINEAILAGGLTPKQAKALSKKAATTAAVLREYEIGIGLHMSHLRASLDQVSKQAAVAGLLAASV